jgi:putative phage-type endonuclease
MTAATTSAAKRVRKSMSAEDALLLAKPGKMPDRKRLIGGSDVAAILALSEWRSPVDVWLEKTGRVDPSLQVSPEKAKILQRGKKLEPYVIDMGLHKLRERGHQVELLARNKRYTHPDFPWLQVEIDAEFLLDGEHINVDAKTVTGFARNKWGDDDSEDVPMDYACQFMTGLNVTGRRRCLVLALIGLDDVMTFWVNRDDETFAWIMDDLVSFWTVNVLKDQAPAPTRLADVKSLHPNDNGRTVEATEAVAAKVAEIRRLGIEANKLTAQRDELKRDVASYLGKDLRLTQAGREVATFRTHEETEVDLAAMRRQHPGLVAMFEHTKPVRVLRFKSRR